MATTKQTTNKPTPKPATSAADKAKGRPSGAKNKPVDYAVGKVTRCARCTSTQRAPYTSKVEHAISGVDAEGAPYTHVVWRRTSCTDCGQHRVDRTTENRPAPKPPAKSKRKK